MSYTSKYISNDTYASDYTNKSVINELQLIIITSRNKSLSNDFPF